MIPVAEAWRALFDHYAEGIRAVTRFRPNEFETRMRDDIRAGYSEYEDQRVVDEVVLDQLLSKNLESEFKCGQLTGTVHIFEEAFIIVQSDPTTRKSGYLVSLDRDEVSVSDLDVCLDYLRTEAL